MINKNKNIIIKQKQQKKLSYYWQEGEWKSHLGMGLLLQKV